MKKPRKHLDKGGHGLRKSDQRQNETALKLAAKRRKKKRGET